MDSAARAAWCQRQFGMMADGGTWGIPRCGLIFQRRGGELVLVAQMPWTSAMPVTEAELLKQQDAEYEATRAAFTDAGIPVRKASDESAA